MVCKLMHALFEALIQFRSDSVYILLVGLCSQLAIKLALIVSQNFDFGITVVSGDLITAIESFIILQVKISTVFNQPIDDFARQPAFDRMVQR